MNARARVSRAVVVAAFVLQPAVLAGQGAVAVTSASAADSIRAAILRGARGFEAGDPDAILAHYAPDVVLSYPGLADMDYETLARSYGELRTRPRSVRASTTPTFDEILVSGDLAIVRLRWTTRIADTATGEQTARRLKDLQIWRREPDGRWLFVRGMHYREPAPVPAAP